jgi:hypothetical protein
MEGFYVLDLVPPCDGLPRYSNGYPGGYVERYSFRGAFLIDCEDVLGSNLLESAWISKLPKDTVSYGEILIERAEQYAAQNGIDSSTCHLVADIDSDEAQIEIVLAAGRWCRFWGERGHWLDAYY